MSYYSGFSRNGWWRVSELPEYDTPVIVEEAYDFARIWSYYEELASEATRILSFSEEFFTTEKEARDYIAERIKYKRKKSHVRIVSKSWEWDNANGWKLWLDQFDCPYLDDIKELDHDEDEDGPSEDLYESFGGDTPFDEWLLNDEGRFDDEE